MAYFRPLITLNRNQLLHLHYTRHRWQMLITKEYFIITLRTRCIGWFYRDLNVNACSLFSCNVSLNVRIALFWVVTQQAVVILYHYLPSVV